MLRLPHSLNKIKEIVVICARGKITTLFHIIKISGFVLHYFHPTPSLARTLLIKFNINVFIFLMMAIAGELL
jgi:hypothetical protein